MLNFKELITTKQSTLYQQDIDSCLLEVKENDQYRWFEYAGLSTQSLMSLKQPEQIILPVYQSLLLFLLWKNSPLNILNLGLGGASIERSLSTLSNLKITSVDSSPTIIDMAKCYFNLPENVEVVCQKAEQFVEHTQATYDVIITDLFIGEKSPEFLFSESFYIQLKSICNHNAVVMINIQADSDKKLLHGLFAIKQQFPFISLIEFLNYSNIVIVASLQEIPAKEQLQKRLANYTAITFTCLYKAIEKMHYIPNNK